MRRISVGTMMFLVNIAGCGLFFGDDSEERGDGGSDAGSTTDTVADESDDGAPPVQEEPYTGDCVPPEWLGEAEQFDSEGAPVSFDLDGTELEIVAFDAPEIAAAHAPLSLEPGEVGSDPIVVFEAATVDGSVGTLVVSGASFAADSGTIRAIGIAPTLVGPASVDVRPDASSDDGSRPDLGPDADPSHVEALAAASPHALVFEDLLVASYEQAYLVTEGGTVPLSGPLLVDAERVYWPIGSTVRATAVEATYRGEVTIGLEPAQGEMFDGDQAIDLPLFLTTADPRLWLEHDGVATLAPTPSRYALDRYGAILTSTVELNLCQSDPLVFSPSETRILRLAYRQSDGLRDAAFASVRVAQADGVEWTARIEVDPQLPAALQDAADANPDSSWGQGLADFLEGWADATEAIGNGIVCVFTLGFLCPDDDDPGSTPTPLAPYPAWMEPGQLGTFELELTAPATLGAHDIDIVIVGQNYEATVSTAIVVR